MTEDKNVLDNLLFLDKFLDYLVNDCKAYSSSFDSLYKHFYGRDLTTDNKANAKGYFTSISKDTPVDIFDIFSNETYSDNTLAQGEKLVECCYYLNKQGLIRADSLLNIKITFEGILKISDNFTKVHETQSTDKNRLTNVENFQRKISRQMLWVTCLIALGTFVAMVYYLLEMISTPYCFCK